MTLHRRRQWSSLETVEPVVWKNAVVIHIGHDAPNLRVAQEAAIDPIVIASSVG